MTCSWAVRALAASAALGLAPALRAQVFQDNTAQIPGGSFNNSNSENVSFSDIDADGDFDAIFADGGDGGNDQNRLWINLGGDQGGTVGFFQDETATRFPSVIDTSRDMDFVDIDMDGDDDIYISNTSAVANQTNRWWVNMGGAQGGTPGFFQDETSARWVNIAGPGSSVANQLKLPSGGFIDWSCDCSFADLDNDGDMDLVHTTYGGIFGGEVPSRLFLNDANGFFEEFNPSGFQLTGTDIDNGDPALWASGQHFHGTTNTTGTQADIADTPLGVELGDLDGDLDVDILQGARNEVPRIYNNQLEENSGVLSPFVDRSFAVLPAGWATGGGNYEQELGDFDADNDLDIYGLNWAGLADVTIRNNGDGTFSNRVVLAGSSDDDNEGDWIDYNGDGNLDLFVGNFSGSDRMYRNTGAPNHNLNLQSGVVPFNFFTTLGCDVSDVDNDGDYDIFAANDFGARNVFYKNLGQTPDVTGARVASLEQAANRAAGPTPTVVRVQVYDNQPWYLTGFNHVEVEYRVDGGALSSVDMMWSGGQIFRGEIPGNLSGTIEYRVRSEDAHGNVGMSPFKTYDATGGCSGDVLAYCVAKTNSCGGQPMISATGVPSATASSGFDVSSTGARANKSGLVLYSENGQANIPFQGGTLCVAPGLKRSVTVISNNGNNQCAGTFDIDWNAFASGNLGGNPAAFLQQVGQQVNMQWWGRDTIGNGSYLSDGLQYEVCP